MKYLILFSIFLSFFHCKNETGTKSQSNKEIEIPFKKEGELQFINDDNVIKTIDIELAETENERNRGLMDRSQMNKNHGMLFVFKEVQPLSFYMKNTRIPLDIIYIDEDSTVINIAKNAIPYNVNGTPKASKPGLFVVEINGGLSDQWGIIEGETKIHWTTKKTIR